MIKNNIIMIGPTGVGKTEIARRLAALAQSPFIKVEASKYTEVGYVGRDVESMVRDLVDLAPCAGRTGEIVEPDDEAEAQPNEKGPGQQAQDQHNASAIRACARPPRARRSRSRRLRGCPRSSQRPCRIPG